MKNGFYEYGVTYSGEAYLKRIVVEWVKNKTYPVIGQVVFDGGEHDVDEDWVGLKVRIWTSSDPQAVRDVLVGATPTELDWVAWVDLECMTDGPED